MNQLLSVVVPAYNEAGNIPTLVQTLSEVLAHYNYEIIIVNDGSQDNTLAVLKEQNRLDARIQYVSLSKNFGHQMALRCGISFAKGDAIISMDADMQHPPSLIPKMIDLWQSGYDIVLTSKENLKNIPWNKRLTTRFFYRFINFLSDINLTEGAADFRLLDKKVVSIINNSPEADLFVRGFVEWVGFNKTVLPYTPAERFSGTAQYSWKKLIALALSGITSFSIKPLRLSAVIGLVISTLAFFYALYAIYIYAFTDRAITGWASILVSLLFLGGLQLLMIGILGEYVGRLFIQAKGRPDYIVQEKSHKP